MDQNICQQLGITVNSKLLDDTRQKKKLTVKALADGSGVAEQTVKNILNGTSSNPQIISLAPICKFLGLTVDQIVLSSGAEEIIEVGEKINDESVLALKETYEYISSLVVSANKANMNDTRIHYEQHHIETVNHFKEIIEFKDAQIFKLEESNKAKVKILIWLLCVTSILFAIVVGLAVMEVMHPQHGWIRY